MKTSEMREKLRLIIVLFAAVLLQGGCSQSDVTFESLLREMVDRDAQARYPSPFYSTKQFSSYDREAVSADSAGWFANSDRTMFIRKEENDGREEYVMFDADGPGAVVRFWMTFAGADSGKGVLRIYIDNGSIPEIEGTAYDILSGGLLVGAPLSASVSDMSAYEMRGHNLYLPLPFGKHCKITYESSNITNAGNRGNTGESVYYNINYRSYQPGTRVTSFSKVMLENVAPLIDDVRKKLMMPAHDTEMPDLDRQEISAVLGRDESWTYYAKGSQAIRVLSLRIKAEDTPSALRKTVLEVAFDGENTIWCPAGDFFGTGYQIRKSDTWFTNVKEDGTMSMYRVMPFKDSCIIRIHNYGDQEISLSGMIGAGQWTWDKRSMHFGASWHQFTHLFTRQGVSENNMGSPFDLTFTGLSGQGVYAGDALTLFNTAYIWWGEGDEKIYVDGETFPSSFGTGTEDYYGYAWGGRSKEFSNHPFIGQPDASGDGRPGYVVNLRYRSLDAIPFSTSFKMDMEMWHWQPTYINYAPVCFYYMKPGGRTDIGHDFAGIEADIALESSDLLPGEIADGRVEAELMAFSNSCGNKRGSMTIGEFGQIPLSNNLHVLWKDGTPGDTIFFRLSSSENKVYDLAACFNTGPGFGKIRCQVNNIAARTEIDLNSRERGAAVVSLGSFRLYKGINTVSFVLLKGGRSESCLFALDCLLLQ
jgi:hypothetical protein